MICGLDSGLIAELEYSLDDLRVEGKEKITENILSYIAGNYDFEIERFYFENESTFVHYNKLDSYFTQKFRDYKLNKLLLVSNLNN